MNYQEIFEELDKNSTLTNELVENIKKLTEVEKYASLFYYIDRVSDVDLKTKNHLNFMYEFYDEFKAIQDVDVREPEFDPTIPMSEHYLKDAEVWINAIK